MSSRVRQALKALGTYARRVTLVLWRHERWAAISLIVATSALAYLPLISQLGFYRDDWYQLWAGTIHGPNSIATLFSIDRPCMGLIYSRVYSILGNGPIAWQIYSFLLRLIGALILLWMLRRLWPSERVLTTLIVVLFSIYPGFLQQPNANTFSNQLLGYTLSILSVAFTLKATTSDSGPGRTLFFALSLLTALSYWLIYEYMIGMEGFRVLVVWVTFKTRNKATSSVPREVLKYLAPFLVLIAGYLIWRIVLFENLRAATEVGLVISRFQLEPLKSLLTVTIEGIKDIIEATFFAWSVPVYDQFVRAELREQTLAIAIGLVGSVLVYVYIHIPEDREPIVAPGSGLAPRASVSEMLAVGILTVVSTIGPVIVAGRDIHWHSGFDRYTLHVTVGVSLFVIGFLWAVAHHRVAPWLVTILVLFSIGAHYLNSLHWKGFWDSQRQMWWQLAWRAPDLSDGTLLIAEIPVDGFLEDYEIWGPANLIYSTDTTTIDVAAEILNQETVDKIRFGSEEDRAMRAIIQFHKDFESVLILAYPSFGSCLHVLDGRRMEVPRSASSMLQSIARYSDVNRVLPTENQSTPLEELFGPEPSHDWCYYYQKADLARQTGAWTEIIDLGEEVFRLGLLPDDRSEWMPFLEGYVALGLEERATTLADLIRQKEPIRKSLCDHLNPGVYQDAERFQFAERILCEFD
jgi:hypothetical protein